MNFGSGRCIAAILTVFSLSACLGGGGSPSPVPSPRGADELTLPENGTLSFDGEAVVVTYSVEERNGGDWDTYDPISSEVESTVRLTTSNSKIVGASFEAPSLSASPSTPNSLGRLGNVAVVALSTFRETGTEKIGAMIIDRTNPNQRFKYQTFGVWYYDPEPDEAGGHVGAHTYGEPTSTNNVPSSETATYSGASTGFALTAVDTAADKGFYVTSQIDVTTDFRTATITSSNTHVRDLDTLVAGPRDTLDFTGTGNVTGAGFKADINGMEIINGKAYGHFYGPNAEEVGGTFGAELMGGDLFDGNGFYVGSFGAAQ